jgi:hypothetical protein
MADGMIGTFQLRNLLRSPYSLVKRARLSFSRDARPLRNAIFRYFSGGGTNEASVLFKLRKGLARREKEEAYSWRAIAWK